MKQEIVFLITDTHFGVKQNSITWLNSQINFIENQLIPNILKEKENNPKYKFKLVHMGDVFDSRSTISTMVAAKVVEIYKKLGEIIPVHIIAGNHDFYSPNSDEIDTLNLLLGNINGVSLWTKNYELIDNDLYVPWYKWGDKDIQEMIDNGSVHRIFTHADIVTERIPYNNTGGIKIFSGHLHIPYIKNNIYNIGSCYPLNFADANHDRGYYILRNDNIEFYTNKESIKFLRLYNEDIFNTDKLNSIKSNDYIEIYISQSNMSMQKYIEATNNISRKYNHIWIIPQSEESINGDLEKFEGYDINKITENIIPLELKDKFEMILNLC